MSQIRRQSIISSMVVYFGFAVGFVNTYLFTREGSGFTKSEYGLISIFIAVATLMYSFANLGMGAYINKFFPYYHDHLPPKKNDLFTWSLLFTLVGCALVLIAGIYFKDLVIRKYGANSPQFIKYYYWVFPFGIGFTLFTTFEVIGWQVKKSVFTNYLREVQFRLFTTILILLVAAGVISGFDPFIKMFSFAYLAIALILLVYLIYTKNISFTFSVSKVTRRFFKKIITLASFVYGGNLVYAISSVFDSILIAAVLPDGLALAGIYTLAQNLSGLIQAPQRGIISASVGPLSRAWKEKNMSKINKIYHSSSINQLLFSIGMFLLIWLNFSDAVFSFHLQPGYIAAKWIFFYIGLMRIVDMGTGLNSQIINTSTLWRFDFLTGIILLTITLPLNYILTKYYFGVQGPAISNLITFTIYNAIRYWFLFRKFKLQPFTIKTMYTILLGGSAYFACHFLFEGMSGFPGLIVRSIAFIALYGAGAFLLKLSPDLVPVWETMKKKMGMGSK